MVLVAEFWVACGKSGAATKNAAASGQSIYMLHCTACHNPNPALDGSLGPALKGSALELLEARVLRGEYPPGYIPKRATHIMTQLPLTEEEVDSIHAFLNAP
jgi:mono/diheme cytochrome c family protein